MASLIWDKSKAGKTARILFVVGDRRPAVRLGRVPVKVATTWLFRIEQLVANLVGGVAHDADLAGWLRDLPEDAHGKLSHVGLVAEREVAAAVTLGALCVAFTTRRVVAENSRKSYKQTLDSLLTFFGPEKAVTAVTTSAADEWRSFIATDTKGESSRTKKRLTADNRLSPASVAKRVHVAKQLFATAVRWGWLEKNPFADLRAGSQVNVARSCYVGLEVIDAVLEAAPSVQWRLVLALPRLAGLRVPSEVGSLTWADVDWEHGRLTVRSPKTAHHGRQHASRLVPIVPRLREILADAFDRAEPGETLVVPMAGKRGANSNLRTHLERIVTRAGCQPWPRTFSNLRASFETDLVEQFPAHVAARWLGHTPLIAAMHYLQTRDHHFDAAVSTGLMGARLGGSQGGPKSGAYSGAVEAHKAAQQAIAGNRKTSHDGGGNDTIPEETVVFPEDCEIVNGMTVDRAGIEPATHGFSVHCSTN